MKLFNTVFLKISLPVLSLAFIVQHSLAQNIGIGTTTPHTDALLHVNLGSSISKGILVAGVYNESSTSPSLGAGSRFMFYPGKAALRAGAIDGTQWDNPSIGRYSVAFGNNPIASGKYSIAMGYLTDASGEHAIAAGNATIASGYGSLSLGNFGTASGSYSINMSFNGTASGVSSTAIGVNVISKSFRGTTLGMFNDNSDAPNGTSPALTDRIFQIGNGPDGLNRSNALTILRNGNIGIGTTNPHNDALLQLHLGSSISKGLLVTGSYSESSTSPSLGAGSRMMFYPGKAAFRAGAIDGTQWDNPSIGRYSVAMGHNTIASGKYSVAMGYLTDASGEHAIAAGNVTTASGYGSLSLGNFGTASGNYSTNISFNGTASGDASMALGFNVHAKAYQGTSMGFFNDISDLPGTSPAATDRIFQVGNGPNSLSRSNALTILRNGNMGIGTTSPAHRLHVVGNICATGGIGSCSDIRYKTEILPLTNALVSVMTLQPIYYNWKQEFVDKGFGEERQLGFAAQEIENHFPELVHTDAEGYKAVDYSRLTPVLVQAIKEQQKEMDAMKEELAEMKMMIQQLSK